jgi:hypothetical protein
MTQEIQEWSDEFDSQNWCCDSIVLDAIKSFISQKLKEQRERIIEEMTIKWDKTPKYCEKCGTISKQNERYIINLHEKESNIDELRHNCNLEYYDKIIWHSHPKIAKFYPSLEDILKSIKFKNSQIIYSYIFTQFGFWTLYTTNHIDVSDELKNKINDLLNKLYFMTEKGRTYNRESVYKFINEMNTLLTGTLQISFYPY